MEGNNVSFLVPSCSTIAASEIPVATQIIEEGPRVCPLCSSQVRLFYINFYDKILMCENIECAYPFGYEEVRFVHVDGGEPSDTASLRTLHTSISGSVPSTASWSDIERINRVYDSEDSQFERMPKRAKIKNNKEKTASKLLEKDNILQKNVKDIRGLNMELAEMSQQKGLIKNDKWINNLKNLSGSQLLKPQELDQLKKKKSTLNNKELKINIVPGDHTNTISSIKIDITTKME